MNLKFVIDWRSFTAALALALNTTGCEYLRHEATRSGGAIGVQADKYLFEAKSKNMQAYRGLVVGAALARVGERNVTTSGAAITAVTSINGVAATVSRLRDLALSNCYRDTDSGHVQAGDPIYSDGKDGKFDIADNQCRDNAYPILFESKLPDLYREVYLLGAAVLPSDAFGDLASHVQGGNIIGVIWALIEATASVAQSAHYALAVGRSATEQRAITYTYRDAKISVPSPFTVSDALIALGKDQKPPPDDRQQPDDTAFFAMFALMKEACLRIRRRIEDDKIRESIVCLEKFSGQRFEYTRGLNPSMPAPKKVESAGKGS